MKRRARGQTLVLFSLTLVLLTLMVCLTLAIGMRAREKIELQTLADTAAYSNAVATARVFNTIAVWTRAQVSHMVVLAGAQSHISYAGWYLGALRSTSIAAGTSAAACTAACANPFLACMCPSCVNTGRIALAFNREYNQVLNRFQRLDKAAGTEARLLQAQASGYGVAEQALFAKHLVFLGTGGFAQQVIDLAVPDSGRRGEYSVNVASSMASGEELRGSNKESAPYPALPATHGSRKSGFIRQRQAIPPLRPPMLYLQNQGLGGYFSADGAGYFGDGRHQVQERKAPQAWADDDGWQYGGVVFGGCLPWFVPPSPASGHVMSTDQRNTDDVHVWTGGSPHQGSASRIHTMGRCKECPSVWVMRHEYNLDPDKVNEGDAWKNQWKQPKALVALQRNYAARSFTDPWNLMFRFRFSSSGPGQQVDVARWSSGGGVLNTQMALATGITYYHRHMDDVSLSWAEPPNLFNPFWRATLVPADIDSDWPVQMSAITLAADRDFTTSYGALTLAGFKGIQ